MRCFIAIDLDEKSRGPLAGWIAARPGDIPGVRWCGAAQLHVTLWFLGQTGDAQVSALCTGLTQAATATAPFVLRLDGLGCFPPRGNPRVLWLGASDETDGCSGLIERMAPGLEALGFWREQRPLRPHVTLARSRSPEGGRRLKEIMRNGAGPPGMEMLVRQVMLFESRPSPRGSEYHVLHAAKLGG